MSEKKQKSQEPQAQTRVTEVKSRVIPIDASIDLDDYFGHKHWQMEHLGFYDENIQLKELKNGEIRFRNTLGNIRIFLDHHYELSSSSLSDELYLKGNLVTETDYSEMREHLQFRSLCDGIRLADVIVAAKRSALKRHVNPIREMILGFKKTSDYDFSRFFVDYCGCPDKRLVRLIASKYLLSMVARGLEPGYETEGCLILTGKQGGSKTKFFELLAVKPEFWTNTPISFTNEFQLTKLQQIWIFEFSDLDIFQKFTVEQTKRFLTAHHDKFQRKFANTVTDNPRTVNFGGSSNEVDILPDETGNRRFWVIEPLKIDRAKLIEDMPNIWANVRDYFLANKDRQDFWKEIFFEVGSDEQKLLEESQTQHKLIDPNEELIIHYVRRTNKPAYTTAEIITDSKAAKSFFYHNLKRIMRELGYEAGEHVKIEGVDTGRRGYVRKIVTGSLQSP